MIFWGRDQVTQLSELRLPGHLVEQFDQIEICRVRSKSFLQGQEYGGFEHESVVDGDHSHSLLTIPAWFTSPSDTRVHNVIRHKEEGLEEFGEPS